MTIKSVLGAIARFFAVIAVAAAGLWLATFIHDANSKVYLYSAFGTDERRLWVMGTTSLDTKYAGIDIVDHGRGSNVILESGELDRVLEMFETARTRQSLHWRKIGEITETDVVGPSRLIISAGPGIRFAIVDDGVCRRYDLAPSDFAAFSQAARRARRHFDGDDADKGLVPFSPTAAQAYQATNEAVTRLPSPSPQDCG